MKINLSNSIINISKDATIICNAQCTCIEITDIYNSYTIYPSSVENMKLDFDKIKNKLKG
jgi:hypothetical protein